MSIMFLTLHTRISTLTKEGVVWDFSIPFSNRDFFLLFFIRRLLFSVLIFQYNWFLRCLLVFYAMGVCELHLKKSQNEKRCDDIDYFPPFPFSFFFNVVKRCWIWDCFVKIFRYYARRIMWKRNFFYLVDLVHVGFLFYLQFCFYFFNNIVQDKWSFLWR